MVSTASIVGMFFSIILSAASIAAAYLYFFHKSKAVESGFAGAFGLGTAAYFWSMILLMIPFAGMMSSRLQVIEQQQYILYLLVISIISSLAATVGCLWADWLTNRKRLSFYRGAAVGLGFSTVETVLLFIFSNVNKLRHAFAINNGTYRSAMEAAGIERESIDNVYNNLTKTNPLIHFLGGFERVMIIMIYISLIIIMTKHMYDKKLWKSCLIMLILHLCYTFSIALLGSLTRENMGNLISSSIEVVLRNVLLIVMASLLGMAALKVLRKQGVDAEKESLARDNNKYLI